MNSATTQPSAADYARAHAAWEKIFAKTGDADEADRQTLAITGIAPPPKTPNPADIVGGFSSTAPSAFADVTGGSSSAQPAPYGFGNEAFQGATMGAGMQLTAGANTAQQTDPSTQAYFNAKFGGAPGQNGGAMLQPPAPGTDPAAVYQAELANQQAGRAQLQQDHPYLAGAANMAGAVVGQGLALPGGLLGLIPGMGAVKGAASLLGRSAASGIGSQVAGAAARTALTGAEGGLQGLLTMANQGAPIGDVAKGGAWSAVAAMVLGPLMQGLINKLPGGRIPVADSPETDLTAKRLVYKALVDDGTTPEKMAANMEAAHILTPEQAVFQDVADFSPDPVTGTTPQIAGLLAKVNGRPGPARAIIQKFFGKRLENSGQLYRDQALRSIDQAMEGQPGAEAIRGATTGEGLPQLRQVIDGMGDQLKDPLYEIGKKMGPIPMVDPNLRVVMKDPVVKAMIPGLKETMATANEVARTKGEIPPFPESVMAAAMKPEGLSRSGLPIYTQAQAAALAGGESDLPPTPALLHLIKEHLYTMIRGLAPTDGKNYKQYITWIRQSLADASPEYAAADRIHAGVKAVGEGLDLGTKAVGKGADVVRAHLENQAANDLPSPATGLPVFDPAQIPNSQGVVTPGTGEQMFRVGYLHSLAKKISDAKNLDLLTKPSIQAELGQIFQGLPPDPVTGIAPLDQFVATVTQAQQMAVVDKLAATSASATPAAGFGVKAMNAATHMFGWRAHLALRPVVDALAKAATGMSDQVSAKIAADFFGTGGAKAIESLRQLTIPVPKAIPVQGATAARSLLGGFNAPVGATYSKP